MATFVLIPGAWLGGWCWRAVAHRLRAAGHTAVTPTLTGLGERGHLLTPQVGLDTHILDIVNTLVFEDLREVVLVGHSYAGMVIAAVAVRIPERLRCLVFLDASVPRDGQSNADVLPRELTARIRDIAERDGQGWLVPPPPATDWGLDEAVCEWVRARLTPHPLKSLEQPVALPESAPPLARAFLCTSPPTSFYRQLLERVRADGWYGRTLPGGHYAMLTAPDAVATALLQLEGECGW